MDYYKLPLEIDKLMSNEHQEPTKVDLRMSMAQNIELILQTMPLRYGFDPNFGSILNEYQYATLPIDDKDWQRKFKDKVQMNLRALIEQYEMRLENIEVKLPNLVMNEKGMLEVLVKIQVKGEYGRSAPFIFPDTQIDSENWRIFPLKIPVGVAK
jgi:predicted component of type VI protein secretion system